MSIRLKKMVIGKLDTMFLESFGKFLAEQYDQVLFSSVGSDEKIWIFATFRDDKQFETFQEEITENPYIESFDTIMMNNILKGKKIFQFLPKLLATEDMGEFFGDDEEEEEDGKDTDDNSSEIFF